MCNKNAIISVMSIQKGNKNEKIEVVTPGKFYKKEDSYFVVYKETEISGMKGTTTTLKINPNNVSLLRFGTTRTKMNFKKKTQDVALYDTPYGTLELEFETNDLDVNINDNGGCATIDYNLGLIGQKKQNTILKINVKVQ